MIGIIAEKRTQAIRIAEAMGWSCRQPQQSIKGQLDGEPATLTWAAGHLLGYTSPHTLSQLIEMESEPELLPLSEQTRYSGSRTPASYLQAIEQLLSHANQIIIATDPDREGEAIAYNILNHFHCTLPLQRLWLSEGLSKRAIHKAMAQLLPAHKTKPLYRAAQARNLSDWYFIFPSIAYTRLDPNTGITSVGRVQTPTLKLIVERDQTIKKHRTTPYYQIEFTFTTGEQSFLCRYPVDGGQTLQDPIELNLLIHQLKQLNSASVSELNRTADQEEKISEPHSLSTLQKRLTTIEMTLHQSQVGAEQLYRKGFISYPRTKQESNKRFTASPHSLTTLQGALQQQLHHSASHSNLLIQRLYELGLISYPRTDSQQLPPGHINSPEQRTLLNNLIQIPELSTPAKIYKRTLHSAKKAPSSGTPSSNHPLQPSEVLLGDQPSSTAFQTAHWGIIPTEKPPNLNRLTHRERTAYLEVSRQYLKALYPPIKINQQQLQITLSLPSGKQLQLQHQTLQITEPGWTSAFGHTIEEQPKIRLTKPLLNIKQFKILEQQTQPPPHYNDHTLLQAMELAGNHRSGIGTPATRADTIELLISRGYVKRDGIELRATQRGTSLIQQVPHWLKSANTTAEWEAILEKISNTESDQAACKLRDHFVAQQRERITKLVQEQLIPDIDRSDSNRSTSPTEKMTQYAEHIAYKKKVALPPDYKTSWLHCRAFIEKYKTG